MKLNQVSPKWNIVMNFEESEYSFLHYEYKKKYSDSSTINFYSNFALFFILVSNTSEQLISESSQTILSRNQSNETESSKCKVEYCHEL